MDVFILIHDDDIVSAYLNPTKAVESHTDYLDLLEATWRESEVISTENTFNRFGDCNGELLAVAVVERDGDDETVSVKKVEVE
jgi:hypothetical protein